MPVKMCQRLVEGAADHCASLQANATPPNFDALATSMAAQSNAIAAQSNYLTLGSLVLGAIALVGVISWAYFVKAWAETAAREAVDEWMDKRGVAMISELVAKITPNQVDGGQPTTRGLTQEQQENELRDDK